MSAREGKGREVVVSVDSETRHDLLTLVGQVIGYSELIEEEFEPADDMLRDLQRIGAAGRSLQSKLTALFGKTSTASEAPVAVAESSPATVETGEEPEDPERQQDDDVAGRILVVDDNPANRDMLSRRLERQGYDVSRASGGVEALKLLDEGEYDVVLLDIMMPDLDGYDVLQRIRSDDALKNIPVIMISALDDMESVVRCIEMGAIDHLPKPFDPVLLGARVRSSLSKKRFHDQEMRYLEQIELERKRSDELLHVLLPRPVVEEIKECGHFSPKRHKDIAVLFCDVVGFTPYSESNDAERVLRELGELIETFERISERHGLEKIKTAGDAYMAAAGLFAPSDNPVLDSVACGLEMIEAAKRSSAAWDIRIGINVGPVLAGIVGTRKYLFDIWGDTVNTASRLESHGIPGAVCVSGEAWRRVAEYCRGESRGLVEVKGKGQLEIFRVDGLLGDES